TPLIEFLSKGSHFANITGEKLSEYQVTRAMADVFREAEVPATTFSLAPCWDDQRPYYGLFVESSAFPGVGQGARLAAALDRRLGELNSEYLAKRADGRLGPVRLALLPAGSWQQWDQARLARQGGAFEQYKHPCLIPDLTFRETMPVEREIVEVSEAVP